MQKQHSSFCELKTSQNNNMSSKQMSCLFLFGLFVYQVECVPKDDKIFQKRVALATHTHTHTVNGCATSIIFLLLFGRGDGPFANRGLHRMRTKDDIWLPEK